MLRNLRKTADRLTRLSANIGALGLMVEVTVILIDVIGRTFGKPLYGSQDIITMSMVILVFGGMSMCDRIGGHIAVDIFKNKFSSDLNRLIDIFSAILGAVIFIFIAYAVWESAKISQMLNLSTNLLRLPKVWFQWGLSAFSLITAFGMFARALELALSYRDTQPKRPSA